ncbi:pseudouridine synthase [Flavobacteriaceae bacterium]|nr:pseudouridine synthase [Flavobacteriaceae bacterium]
MLTILFEDDYIIAVHKPNNVLVHHSEMARNQSDEKSLVQLLVDQFEAQFYPVHRLDRKTSGIILFTKSKDYIKPFQDLFLSNEIQKEYYGLVRGHIKPEGEIDSPVKGRDANVHKEALTLFTCKKHYELDVAVHPYSNSRYSLVKLTPKTGRLHQLRIHMNKISHPLIGDPKYGDRFHNRMFENQFGITNMFLHAKNLSFTHPYTNESLVLSVDLPEHWCKIFMIFEAENTK